MRKNGFILLIDDVGRQYQEHEYRGCVETGIQYLKVIHLNKGGWFYYSCNDNLVQTRGTNKMGVSSP